MCALVSGARRCSSGIMSITNRISCFRELPRGVESQYVGRAAVICRGRASRALAELLSLNEEKNARPRLKPATVLPGHPVPDHITKPPWYTNPGKQDFNTSKLEIHNADGIQKMRAAGKLASKVLAMAGGMVKAGVTTEDIDKAVHDMTIANGAYPSPLRYGVPPFPKSVCTSVNEVICHGIPDLRPLEEGDIVNVDVTVWLDGYHGDTSRTFYVGEVSPKARQLVEATKEALDAAIAICRPGADFRQIGMEVTKVADKRKFNVVRDFVGHGVGKAFHAGPVVFHHKNNERQGTMKEGQTFTIEPMLAEGSIRSNMWKDGWTAVTTDGKLSAQFEHTLLITSNGVEVLTAYE